MDEPGHIEQGIPDDPAFRARFEYGARRKPSAVSLAVWTTGFAVVGVLMIGFLYCTMHAVTYANRVQAKLHRENADAAAHLLTCQSKLTETERNNQFSNCHHLGRSTPITTLTWLEHVGDGYWHTLLVCVPAAHPDEDYGHDSAFREAFCRFVYKSAGMAMYSVALVSGLFALSLLLAVFTMVRNAYSGTQQWRRKAD
jgi:hypothetical protein